MRVNRRVLVVVLVGALAGCAGPATPRAPIDERGGAAEQALDAPEAVLRALAAAIHADDGAALDRLIHPAHGLWLWIQPGAYVSPTLRVTAGGAVPPSARIGGDDMIEYWREHFWTEVARGLDAGLPRLDHDPGDHAAGVYGDCGEEVPAAELRAYLATREDLGTTRREIAADAMVTLAPVVTDQLVHFRRWGLDVWMARDRGRLWVVHVMVWTPCDA